MSKHVLRKIYDCTFQVQIYKLSFLPQKKNFIQQNF